MFRRRLYSQNFLHSRTLVKKLVRSSSIGQKDLVLDLGIGAGIISEVLLSVDARVVAVEVDIRWVNFCKQLFEVPQVMSNLDSCSSSLSDEVSDLRVDDLRRNDKFSLLNQDILEIDLPRVPYKVFSNIPFAIEGKIIRKLLTADNPPNDSYLVIREDLAKRLLSQNKTTLFAVLFQPFFQFSIEYNFARSDFLPAPNLSCVLFRFVQRDDCVVISFEQKRNYWDFVAKGFENGDSVFRNLVKSYGMEKISKLFQKLSIRKNVKPTQISMEIWQKMFLALNTV